MENSPESPRRTIAVTGPDGEVLGHCARVIELSNSYGPGYGEGSHQPDMSIILLNRIAVAAERIATAMESLAAEHGAPAPMTPEEQARHNAQIQQLYASGRWQRPPLYDSPPWAGQS